jgi:hypothetical protein
MVFDSDDVTIGLIPRQHEGTSTVIIARVRGDRRENSSAGRARDNSQKAMVKGGAVKRKEAVVSIISGRGGRASPGRW